LPSRRVFAKLPQTEKLRLLAKDTEADITDVVGDVGEEPVNKNILPGEEPVESSTAAPNSTLSQYFQRSANNHVSVRT